ncbi:metallophosphoesterase [Candidatus Woesearchaeota archaeon]|nr:metallophosphoesterase [Candidatus Woesearchaeota archaeon]
MKILPDMEIVDLGLWLKNEKVLVVGDFHLGYEETLKGKGVLMPRFQLKDIIERLERILETINPEKIVINGDLKHEFGKVLNQEWRDVLKLVDFLLDNCKELILVRGNHDTFLLPIARKRGVQVVNDYSVGDVFICHGNEVKETSAKKVVVGHEHPAISLREKEKVEKYKCFLVGKWRRKSLVVMPSFNPISDGSDVLEGERFSPYLEDISNFGVFVVGEKIYDFGKIEDLN